MIKNYLKIAWRNLVKYKAHSLINITGLSVGIAVALLIGLWIRDELTFNQYHKNYKSIARIAMNGVGNGVIGTQWNIPYPMGDELRLKYGSNFKHIVMATGSGGYILTTGDKKLLQIGNYMEPDGPELLSLKMLKGNWSGLKDPASILLSASAAKGLFGSQDPMNKLIKINNKLDAKVTGVYEDIPDNSSFSDLAFIAPWEQYLQSEKWVRQQTDPWGWNQWYTYVQMADNADPVLVSKKIKEVAQENVTQENKKFKSEVFLDPMRFWHLYSRFENGVRSGGPIEFVWLFSIIGVFVLLLACINFMNLSTARSEKRAREVGIRKAVGSLRSQLITQFFCESILVVFFSFLAALILVQLAMPTFNLVAGKVLTIPWHEPMFWIAGISFSLFTGIIAGSYPALYLSSFQPVKVLKGAFRAGRLAALPRKILVVLQFSVSAMLIIGTIVVFRQVQFAKSRPVGYDRTGLIVMRMSTDNVHKSFDAIKTQLVNAGAITDMAESQIPVTDIWSTNGNISWAGKDPNQAVDFPNSSVSYSYGKTVGWQFIAGRDFSSEFLSDTSSFVINEATVKFMGLKNPVGTIIKWGDHPLTVIGVIKDVVMESPYQPVPASLFHLSTYPNNFLVVKLDPRHPTRASLDKIASVFKKYNPAVPFDYTFVDEAYAQKFGDEERLGKLASYFAVLAIFISCMGLFGMASFMAEQRTKEIGVRKVLGASVFGLWRLMSADFIVLVLAALVIAMPLAWYFMGNWLQHYTYRAAMSWWIFAATGVGALGITLLTISYQSIKAALANPVNSLKSE